MSPPTIPRDPSQNLPAAPDFLLSQLNWTHSVSPDSISASTNFSAGNDLLRGETTVLCDAFGDLVEKKQAKGCLFGGVGSRWVKVCLGGAGLNAVPVSKGLTWERVTSVLIFIPWHTDSARLLAGLCAHWLLPEVQ